mmetsp:Transcript_38583/g.62505  ORF Transcript_38583/g.62505 Transcript_38583/m.62505 type:complete len:205 (-) Transcript_38583:3406-4020(-)
MRPSIGVLRGRRIRSRTCSRSLEISFRWISISRLFSPSSPISSVTLFLSFATISPQIIVDPFCTFPRRTVALLLRGVLTALEGRDRRAGGVADRRMTDALKDSVFGRIVSPQVAASMSLSLTRSPSISFCCARLACRRVLTSVSRNEFSVSFFCRSLCCACSIISPRTLAVSNWRSMYSRCRANSSFWPKCSNLANPSFRTYVR